MRTAMDKAISYDEREVKSFPVRVVREVHVFKGLDVRKEVWELVRETDEGVWTEEEFRDRFGTNRKDYGGTDYHPVIPSRFSADRGSPGTDVIYRFEIIPTATNEGSKMSYKNIVRLSAALRSGTREMTELFDSLGEEALKRIAKIAEKNTGYVPPEVLSLLKKRGFLSR